MGCDLPTHFKRGLDKAIKRGGFDHFAQVCLEGALAGRLRKR